MSDPVSRRLLLAQAAVLAGAALTPRALFAATAPLNPDADNPFTLGVASGEPEPDGFVIWTRLAPRPLEADGGLGGRAVPLTWEVAEDQGFKRIVRRGRATAAPEWGHSVHIEISGLRPGRDYWYRFRTSGGASPVGRALTTPPTGAAADRLRFAFGSCQKYEAGFYAAYRHMVQEAPDLYLFLGDYIYEDKPGSRNAVRLHQNPECLDLAGYRIRYATYKTDPLLQAAHAACPWVTIWDDHEVQNDYGGDRAPDQNRSQGFDPAAFLRRRAAAYQAYYENMPLRRRTRPVGPDMLLYRTLDWGRLAQFQLVDDRQYRSARPCVPREAGAGKMVPDCPARMAAERSMLGARQEAWLSKVLGRTQARWNVLGQQTLFAPELQPDPTGAPRYNSDGWDNAPASRDRIIARWRGAKVSNPVVLGGDIHMFAAADSGGEDGRSPVAAPVFVGGSISSLIEGDPDMAPILAANPGIKLLDPTKRGYGMVELKPGGGEVAFRALADSRREDSGVSTLVRYALEDGRPNLTKA